ncbi:hypothetical protein EB796_017490 [Bugula neritina]|uniref:Uncharacterized protein n=1 Tax=Bugula neritina TaxID=10212 RepID=A0A7J7JDV7_BUGNE|nr:hypothetical protein EB796_017490 [Bugula neritina]
MYLGCSLISTPTDTCCRESPGAYTINHLRRQSAQALALLILALSSALIFFFVGYNSAVDSKLHYFNVKKNCLF